MFCTALTFDDGYLSHMEYARLLYRLSVPGTFFIITGLRYYRGRKLLINEPRLLREMADMGHEIGSHTHTHKDLTRMSTDEIEREFEISKSIIRELVDYDIGIAYPYGAFNETVIRITEKHFIYGRVMGSYNRWNEKTLRYTIGGMGVRHLVKLPIKAIKGVRLVVVVFHTESPRLVRLTIDYLRAFNARFVTMREGLKCLGL